MIYFKAEENKIRWLSAQFQDLSVIIFPIGSLCVIPIHIQQLNENADHSERGTALNGFCLAQ